MQHNNPEQLESEYPLMQQEQAPQSSAWQAVCGVYSRGSRAARLWVWGLTLLAVALIVALVAVLVDRSDDGDSGGSNIDSKSTVSRIAFGSCSSYNLEKQKLWVDGVIPAEPDAWIWAGDMVYLDDPNINCEIPQDTDDYQRQCNCTSDWLKKYPNSCTAGDVEHARGRYLMGLRNNEYNQFLDFMCPAARAQGLFPPPGTDPTVCTRPILGTYDDHDYGWNNGNERLPNKDEFKTMYLDAIGESPTSPRRNHDRGLWWKYTLNANNPHKMIDVFLLDERYEREPVPCYTYRDYCERYALLQPGATNQAWCEDFLHGGYDGQGTCCDKDEQIFFGWCLDEANKDSEYYEEACDVTSPKFGMRSLVLNDEGELVEPDASYPYDVQQKSPFCEMLGRNQRKWLRQALNESKAPLKLLVSGSVVLAEPYNSTCATDYETGEPVYCQCAGDDWGCYKVAQRELLHLAAEAPGCTIILTGDYHWSDIKVLKPGDQVYAEFFDSYDNPYPLYQVMASGLTSTTGIDYTCADFRLDPAGLRDHPECDFVTGPAFGLLDVGYDKRGRLEKVTMQIRDGTNVVRLESQIEASVCNPY